MAPVALLQAGLVKHLPDPPSRRFDSDKVNSSDTAYRFGVPDGTVSLGSFALNVPLAALGGRDRAHVWPWVPLVAAAKAAAEAAVAVWYFAQMPTREKAWCGYCITAALVSLGIFMLTLPEAAEAVDGLRSH